MKFLYTQILLLLLAFSTNAQIGNGNAMHYQAVARNSSGVVSNQTISVKIGIYSGVTLFWEETHTVTTNQDGFFTIDIGTGSSTGLGIAVSYSSINWGATLYYIQISVDYNGGTSYGLIGNSQLMSVPYVFHSLKTKSIQVFSLNDLADVNATSIPLASMLKWDGAIWKPLKDNHSDTVSVAYNSNHAINVDTVNYSHKVHWEDTVAFTNFTNTVNKASNAKNALNSNHSLISDTANYALNIVPFNWGVSGNVITTANKFVGSINSSDLIFKTSNTERSRLLPNGNLGIGITAPAAPLHINGIDGLLSVGVIGSGALVDSSTGRSRFIWYPRKAALYMGETSLNWSDTKIGNYSFSAGYNCLSHGVNTVSIGINCKAMDSSGVSIGKDCWNYRLPADPDGFGGSIAMGDSVVASYTRSIAMGHAVVSYGASGFGYRNKCRGGTSTAVFGSYNNANSTYSIIFGTNASTNGFTGCFLFSDASAANTLLNTSNNQFMVRASGGVIFYADSITSTGVQLFSGSGSWAMVSDKNKKDNYKLVDEELILNKISKLNIGSWSYKSESKKIKHVGPFAQDLYTAFSYGESDTLISSVDINGITFIGIKALAKKTTFCLEKFGLLPALQAQTCLLKSEFDDIDDRLKNIETILSK
jgi:hypothetical protein